MQYAPKWIYVYAISIYISSMSQFFCTYIGANSDHSSPHPNRQKSDKSALRKEQTFIDFLCQKEYTQYIEHAKIKRMLKQ